MHAICTEICRESGQYNKLITLQQILTITAKIGYNVIYIIYNNVNTLTIEID